MRRRVSHISLPNTAHYAYFSPSEGELTIDAGDLGSIVIRLSGEDAENAIHFFARHGDVFTDENDDNSEESCAWIWASE